MREKIKRFHLLKYFSAIIVSVILVACRTENNTVERQLIDNTQVNESNEYEISAHLSPTVLPSNLQIETIGDTSTKDNIDEMKTQSMAQKFCDDMTLSWLKLKRIDMSEYLIDNLDTHLALKFIDFDIADRLKNTWKQIEIIESVILTNGKLEKISENKVHYETFVEIDYTRYEPSVNGIGIDLEITLEMIDEKWMITSIDIVGSSIYREWKDGNYTTIEEMDKAFENSCKELGIQ